MVLRGVTLESAPPVTVTPENDEKLIDAVGRLRAEIASTKQSLQRVRSVGLPLDAQRSLIAQAVAERARAARPAVSITDDVCRISWPEGVGVSQLLAWIDPRRLIDALTGELSEPPNAMPQSERLKCVAELEAELDQLERREVVLVEYAHENGVDVLPRIDMSPSAFLGVVVKAQATAQQVA